LSVPRVSARSAAVLAIVLGCAAVGLSLVGRSRVWLHTTGSLHTWYHLVLFGVLGALAVRTSRRFPTRVAWLVSLVVLGLMMEWIQARGNHVGIEWPDVQMDWLGVGFGCFTVWLLPGRMSKVTIRKG
jgi:hypothetical protein